jgi:hypothetical protein
MIFKSEFAESVLDIVFGGVLRNPEDLIVVFHLINYNTKPVQKIVILDTSA